MIFKFTDEEYAVIHDSLATTRDHIQLVGGKTPNLDSALEKLGKWAHPSGCEFVVVTGDDALLVTG